LRHEVESLLAQDGPTEEFLPPPAAERALIGRRIARYRAIEEIGRGNTGTCRPVFARIITLTVFTPPFSFEILFGGQKKRADTSQDGNRSGNNSRFRLNLLLFVGDFAYFLRMAERGGFEPPTPFWGVTA